MKKYWAVILGFLGFAANSAVHSEHCPDPQTTSLQWGAPPSPWIENPFSANSPQGDENTRFVRANIVVAGYGQGVVCTYRIATGDYSIWWPVRTKIPAPTESSWMSTLGGFVCSQGLDQCQFQVLGG